MSSLGGLGGTPIVVGVGDPSLAHDWGSSGAMDASTSRDWGAAALYGLGILLCLYSFYFVTDLRLVPATRRFCDYFHIPDDVAGATVLGAALNAPELFTGAIATLVQHNNVGVGVVMGSWNFNVFLISGLGAIVARRKLRSRQLKLNWLFLQRDVYFYAASVLAIVLFTRDGILTWPECLGMVLIYVAYVIICAYSGAMASLMFPGRKRYKPRRREEALVNVDADGDLDFTLHPRDAERSAVFTQADLSSERTLAELARDEAFRTPAALESLRVQEVNTLLHSSRDHALPDALATEAGPGTQAHESTPLLAPRHVGSPAKATTSGRFLGASQTDDWERKLSIHASRCPEHPQQLSIDLRLVQSAHDPLDRDEPWATDALAIAEEVGLEEEAEDYHAAHVLALPGEGATRLQWLLYIINFPFHVIVHFTMPYGKSLATNAVAATIAMAWLAGISFLLSGLSQSFGEALLVPDRIVGLTLDAVGTSMPNALAALSAAKLGNCEVAICQAFGSNTFDALIAFGLVQFVKVGMGGFQPIVVKAKGVEKDGVVDLAMLFMYVWLLYFFRMRLTKRFGWACLVLYFGWLGCQLAKA